MKKFKDLRKMPVVVVGMLLLIPAVTFPTLAQNIQIKGIEKAGRELETNSLEIPYFVAQDNQNVSEVTDFITMTEEEEKLFDELALLVQKSTLLTTPVNRELRETESERMMELRKKFRSGTIKSEKTLPIGENLEKPYFNPENETYYYPETEMTDEQLLQIIDFDEKLNRALSKLYEEYIQKVMDNSDIKISEEEAIKSAKDTIERVYNVKLDNMKTTCMFDADEFRNEKSWRIVFQPKNLDTLREQKKLYWMYFAKVDIYNGKVNYVDSYYSNQMEETKESVETDLNNIDEHKKISEEILIDKLNAKNVKFLKAYVRKPNTMHSFNKILYLVYKAEDRYIEIEFLYGSKRMVALCFYDDPSRLNDRINEIEQDSIGNIFINKVAKIEDNGRRIPANSQVLQLKDGAKVIVSVGGELKYEPENMFFNLQKKISDEIFDSTGMRIEFKVGALKYEPENKMDITKTKIDVAKKYPARGIIKDLKDEDILTYRLEKGSFTAHSENYFEAEFYLENGKYGGEVESEFNHDTEQYELNTTISEIDYYITVLKNRSEVEMIDIKYEAY